MFGLELKASKEQLSRSASGSVDENFQQRFTSRSRGSEDDEGDEEGKKCGDGSTPRMAKARNTQIIGNIAYFQGVTTLKTDGSTGSLRRSMLMSRPESIADTKR